MFNFNETLGADFSKYINKELKGTKTEQNLKEAYCGESKARNNYTFFAEKAKAEGYQHIAKIFEETAHNEKEHARIWLKLLTGGNIQTTLENLKTAAETENYEWESMYERYAQDAREEGFNDIAYLFDTIRTIEKSHMNRYKKEIENILNNLVFQKEIFCFVFVL